MSRIFHSGWLAHPEDEQLLRYADGELTARQARKIRSHLQACWQCRAELDEISKTVAECVRYRKQVMAEHLPAPPARWADLTGGFDEIDRELGTAARRAVLRQMKTWLPLAAAFVLACGIYWQLHQTPAVEAAELLRKAVATADAAPAKPHRIRIRTKQRTVVRAVGMQAEPGDPADAMLRSAHFDTANPLSARAFARWRDQLPDKQDEVTTAENRYRIRTRTGSGELAEATLQLRTSDLRPIEERLEFRNQDWIEIEELMGEPIPPPMVASDEAQPAPAQAAPAAAPHEIGGAEQFREPAPAATVGDELQVLVALHKLGADLGDPIRVHRTEGRVLVAGVGIDLERQREIEQALGTRQNVVVQFSKPSETTAQPEKSLRSETGTNAEGAGLQTGIERQLGGRANYEQLSGDVLDASDKMMSRAYALRRLAEAFPPEVEREMTAADRQTLHELYRDHAAVLAQQTAGLTRLLKPVLAPLGGTAGAAPPAAPAIWQDDTEKLFRTARRVESLLAVMLGVAPGETAGLPSQVLSGLAQLRASAEAYGPAMAP